MATVVSYFQLIQIFHEKPNFYQSQSYGLYLSISTCSSYSYPLYRETNTVTQKRTVLTPILVNVCGQCIFLFMNSKNSRSTFNVIFSKAFLLLHLVPTRHFCTSVLSNVGSKAQLCNKDLYRSERSSS